MTTQKFVSVKKSDPEFQRMLWGNVEPGHVALPLKSLNVGTLAETVTFQVVPQSEITKPNLLKLFAEIIKLKSFLLIFVPFFFILAKNLNSQDSWADSLVFAFAALCFIFASLNARNDVSDHITGFDRVNISTRPKPIQAGWISAQNLNLISKVLLVVGILFSVPVVIIFPSVFWVIAGVLALIAASEFLNSNSYKKKWSGELALFLSMGIGVTAGLQLSYGLAVDSEVISFGIMWGLVVLFIVHVNNFSHIMTSMQAGIANSVTRLGFDSAKKFICFWWLACLIAWELYHLQFGKGYFRWFGFIPLVIATIPYLYTLLRASSPIGSELVRIRTMSYQIFLLLTFLFFIENFGLLWKS